MKYIEKYVSEDVFEIIEDITAIVKVDELKESIMLARELRENMATINAALCMETASELIAGYVTTQVRIVHELQNALTVVQAEAIKNAEQLSQMIDTNALQKLENIIINLQEELAISEEFTPIELKGPKKDVTMIEPGKIVKDATLEEPLPVKEVEQRKEETKVTTAIAEAIVEAVDAEAVGKAVKEKEEIGKVAAAKATAIAEEGIESDIIPAARLEEAVISEDVKVLAKPIAGKVLFLSLC